MKQLKGTITEEMLKDTEKVFFEDDKFNEWLKFLEVNEPVFFNWAQNTTSKMLTAIAKSIKFTMEDGHRLAQNIITCLIFSYVTSYQNNKKKIDDILKIDEDEYRFKLWLDGKLGKSFYHYPLTGLDKDSSLYEAKMNFLKQSKQNKELKKIAKAKEDFHMITRNASKLSMDEELITDDELSDIEEFMEQNDK